MYTTYTRKTRCRLTGRTRNGPPCSAGCQTAYVTRGRPARPPAALQTTTDDSEQINTGPLRVPVITIGQLWLLGDFNAACFNDCLYT